MMKYLSVIRPAVSELIVIVCFGALLTSPMTAFGQETGESSKSAVPEEKAKPEPKPSAENVASPETKNETSAEAKPQNKDASKPKKSAGDKGGPTKKNIDEVAESKPSNPEPKTGKKPVKPKAPKPPQADPAWVAKGVWTLPPSSGPAAVDFSLVGEYVGEVKESDVSGRVGVQIRNLGAGKFEARVHQGGLPGEETFTEKETIVLIGRRHESTLVLSGGPWAMFASPKECRLITADGNTIGKLPRIERASPTLMANPPEGAIVLFDGTGTENFAVGKMTKEGLLQQGADINFLLHDFDLHLEFRIPHMPGYTEQARGNSGIYLQSRYECQVLDSFGDSKVFNGLGALYRFKPPQLNMAFPPLKWQTYDIHFTAARFAVDQSKLRNARVTSWVNGVKVQDDVEVPGPTGAGKDESPTLLPTKLQDHRDPVRYRNVWVIDRGLAGGIPFPVMAE